ERPMALLPNCRNRVRVNGARALRLVLAVAALVAAAALAAAALATSHSETSLPTLNHQVLAALNRFRVAHGLVALRESAALDRSARQHSLEMGRVGYFAHPSADGTAFWKRIKHYYTEANYSYWSVGENLLWRSPGVNAGQAMKLWIASPEHLRNLLTPQWRQLGVSAVRVVHAPGVFHGARFTTITTGFCAGRYDAGALSGSAPERVEPGGGRAQRQPEVEDSVDEDGQHGRGQAVADPDEREGEENLHRAGAGERQ